MEGGRRGAGVGFESFYKSLCLFPTWEMPCHSMLFSIFLSSISFPPLSPSPSLFTLTYPQSLFSIVTFLWTTSEPLLWALHRQTARPAIILNLAPLTKLSLHPPLLGKRVLITLITKKPETLSSPYPTPSVSHSLSLFGCFSSISFFLFHTCPSFVSHSLTTLALKWFHSKLFSSSRLASHFAHLIPLNGHLSIYLIIYYYFITVIKIQL